MTTARWQRIQELFEKASTYPPEERESVVADACGDDAELRSEVVSLLEHDEHAPADFMQAPAPDAATSSLPIADGPDPLIGTRISTYQIKSVIASGGMGTVYEAEQMQPKRTVALKVIRPGIVSRSALKRFEHESQILAGLRHPSIAQVYEAGTHRNEGTGGSRVPYFAMEYVPGARPITRYADEQRLDTRERLELFATVCDAIHHGHQKGIIHRDLKPANILVDAAGQVKVIDFGVARSTDSDLAVTTQRTDVGQLIGTVQYMSPEQCEADPVNIDIRSDVYSLGVVLYELLCRQLPYDVTNSAIHVAARTICEWAPVRPSTINRKLRGDLEIVALKALEKDRERRYQSTADLARDVHHCLKREPIEAKPPTPWTRLTRWMSRHPYATTAAGCATMIAFVAAATFVSVTIVNFRPHKLTVAEKGQTARLVARTHRILHEWDGKREGAVVFAQLVRTPPELGNRALAIVGFTFSYDGERRDERRGTLCAFDVSGNDLETPIWSSKVRRDNMPEEAHQFNGRDFHPSAVFLVADIFHDVPGDEIAAVFTHVYSRRAIRVYDLDGEVLYEVWHHGGLSHIYWMSGPGLLIVGADTTALPEYTGQGIDGGPSKQLVVFALKPRRGVRRQEYINPEFSPRSQDVRWYRYIQPTEACRKLKLRGIQPGGPSSRYPPESHAEVVLKARTGRGTFAWTVDQDGNKVPGTLTIDDTYKLNQETLPDPKTVDLADDVTPVT